MADLIFSDAKLVDEPLEDLGEANGVAKGIWWKNTKENYGHFSFPNGEAARGLLSMQAMIKNVHDALVKTQDAGAPGPKVGRLELLYDKDVLKTLYRQGFLIDEEVRPEGEAPPISDAEWNNLRTVGTFNLKPIMFSRASYKLDDAAKLSLSEVSETIRLWPQYYLKVQGHASGKDPADRELAADRAREVKRYLVETEKIPTHRIRSEGTDPGPEKGKVVDFVALEKPQP